MSLTPGSILTVDVGSWSHMAGVNPSFTYQWQRDGVNIAAATNFSYVIQTADVGHSITCVVTAHNDGGAVAAISSNAIVPVAPIVVGPVSAGQQPRSVPLVQVELLVQWETVAAGALEIASSDADLTVGTIAANDADTAAGTIIAPEFTATFGGPYDDLSSLFRDGTCQRGRSDDLSQTQAATAQFTVRDNSGLFNYKNPGSPLFGQIETMMHPIRWRIGSQGAWTTKFWGYTQRITFQPGRRKGVTVFQCVDLFYRLDNDNPLIAPMGQTTTGAAINAILDAIDWPDDPDTRVIAVGDTIPDFSADGTKSGLALIGDLLTAERGDFYIRGDGIPIYEDRFARFHKGSQGTVTDLMTDVQPEVDFDLVRNSVTVNRTDTAGNILYTATASDPASIAAMGEIEADPISTPYLALNSDADGLAALLLDLLASPTPPARSLTVDGRDPNLVALLLTLEFGDRLTVQEPTGGTDGDFMVEQLQVAVVPPGRISGAYTLSTPVSSFLLLLIASDDTDTGVGVIAANDADTDAGVLTY